MFLIWLQSHFWLPHYFASSMLMDFILHTTVICAICPSSGILLIALRVPCLAMNLSSFSLLQFCCDLAITLKLSFPFITKTKFFVSKMMSRPISSISIHSGISCELSSDLFLNCHWQLDFYHTIGSENYCISRCQSCQQPFISSKERYLPILILNIIVNRKYSVADESAREHYDFLLQMKCSKDVWLEK